MIAVIKSDTQYDEVLARVTALAELDPSPESEVGKELEVLALLLKDYESRKYPLPPPSPIAAIKLRMDQLSLSPKELVPFLGTRSRVSEVLTGKRPLSIAMIRSLHDGLGIPLESLVSEELEDAPTESVEWDRFPIREMQRLGWISPTGPSASKRVGFADAERIMQEFFNPVGGVSTALGVLHKTDRVRTGRHSDRFALAAWAGHVRRCADSIKVQGVFQRTEWGVERIRELRSLSRYDVGPRLAVQYLSERGIVVVIAPHLKRTRLDGAALLRRDGVPVIALTLRHDRLDNFWFTLFHELMHVLLHLTAERHEPQEQSLFLDDLDVAPDVWQLEKHADDAAREALLPTEHWATSAVRYAVAPATVNQLALEAGISEAIVAGRVRFETGNYRLLSAMIGTGQVRSLFTTVTWPEEHT